MDALPPAFEALAAYKQFVIYRLEPRNSHPGKMDKIPIHPYKLNSANAHAPTNWIDATTAMQITKLNGIEYGVGFALTKNDPFFFIDIDDCLEPCGEWSPLAKELCGIFPHAAVEVSNSGRGLHIIGSSIATPHSCKNSNLNIEFYTENRFVALTGLHARGNAGEDYSAILPGFVNKYFSLPLSTNISRDKSWTTQACEGSSDTSTDEQLIRRALNAKSGATIFGNKASFEDLWEANAEKLIITYPSSTHVNGYDESAADAALAQHLAFWTGKNCERIRRLMVQSKLNREKWNREDYLPRTILGACARKNEFLGSNNELSNSQVISSKKQSFSILEWTDINIRDIFTNPPKPLLFLIDDLLPAGLLTFFAGHGGSGKSMLALQASICLATGLPFMEKTVKKSRVMFFSGEDSAQIIQLRLAKLCLHMEVDPLQLAENLQIIDATKNPFLYIESVNNYAGVSLGYSELHTRINDIGVDVVIIDNASDTFDANENIRSQVRGFMRALTQLDVAVLLLAHVDKQTAKGENSSEGYSGSTQWHNSARSRWYLKADDVFLTLQHKKSNHGKLSADILLVWSPNGVLVGSAPINTQEILDIVLSLVGKHFARGNFISTAPTSPMNPFRTLKADPAFPSSIRSCTELMKLLCQAEDAGLLIREHIPAKRRGETREIFALAPTARTCSNIVSAVSTEPLPL
jgi:hypothetical protein